MSTDKLSRGAFAVCRDRSSRRTEGKYANRAKQDKPASRLTEILERQCGKKCFRSVERVKSALERARAANMRAQEGGFAASRREIRWYECHRHAVPMFHLTSVEEADYTARFEASRRGEFHHAA